MFLPLTTNKKNMEEVLDSQETATVDAEVERGGDQEEDERKAEGGMEASSVVAPDFSEDCCSSPEAKEKKMDEAQAVHETYQSHKLKGFCIVALCYYLSI